MNFELIKLDDGSYKKPSKWKLVVRNGYAKVSFIYYHGPAFRISLYKYSKAPHDLNHYPYKKRIRIPSFISLHDENILKNHTQAEEPKIEHILECIEGDCKLVGDGKSFPEFCSELGLNTDSRKARKLYRACWNNMRKCLKVGLMSTNYYFDYAVS